MLQRRAQGQGISVADAEKQLASSNSIKRIIDAQDVASVVTFLASPRSVAINGDVIAAGGGSAGPIFY